MTVDVRVTNEKVHIRSRRAWTRWAHAHKVGGVVGSPIVFHRGSVEGQRDDMDGPIVRLVHVRTRFHLKLFYGGQLPAVPTEVA